MYDVKMTKASKSALVEVASSLSMYRDDFVLAGGWVPYFLTRGDFDHCGSRDIDLVLRPSVLTKYDSIRKIVERLGFSEVPDNPFRFERQVTSPTDKREYSVKLDFLTEPSPAEQAYPLIQVQRDLRACLIQGSSIVFKLNYKETVEGVLPGDGKIKLEMKVANVVGCLVMKGLALPRLSDKDSYDIYAVAGLHKGGPEQASQVFLSQLRNVALNTEETQTLRSGLGMIQESFKSPDSQGPYAVSRFIGQEMNTESYMRVNAFLRSIEPAFR